MGLPLALLLVLLAVLYVAVELTIGLIRSLWWLRDPGGGPWPRLHWSRA